VLAKLNITLRKDLRELNFQQRDPETGKGAFLAADDIDRILPNVKDYRHQALKYGDPATFPVSINTVLDLARRADAMGTKS